MILGIANAGVVLYTWISIPVRISFILENVWAST